MRTTAKSTAALALLPGIKGKHSVLTKDADVLYQFLAEHLYTWHVRGAKWIKRTKQ